ncbi:MAG: HRDC domain-containing protein, partial [Muribaculaceae bacterium]|nr:HRDC domain-containing protein [Muribaculaceae bacterium]
FNLLKDLRREIAREHHLPPYVIFQDPSLEAMATTYPITIDELRLIPGVGDGKAKRYGKEFVELIKLHVEENEIERPDDFRMRAVAGKGNVKIFLIQCTDRKIGLDDLARDKGMDFDDLLTELEAIVYSGYKINIDYYLNSTMDKDIHDDLYNYFRQSESDDLQEAIDYFDGDYTEQEVRLVRIQFLSDMGN